MNGGRIARGVSLSVAIAALGLTDTARATIATPAPSGGGAGIYGEGSASSASVDVASGIAHSEFAFDVPGPRGMASRLALTYSSEGGPGVAGLGWSLDVPAIERSIVNGVPSFDNGNDRFDFGGSALVPICVVSGGSPCAGDAMPSWATGWRYFRPQVEGGFYRAFLSPDGKTWRVQRTSGETEEYGAAVTDAGDGELAFDADHVTGQIFRWKLVRRYTRHGGPSPVNVIAYHWQELGGLGLSYLTDVYDTPPATGSGGPWA